jgi:integrase
MRELQQGSPKADGSMSLKGFWDEIYYPVHSPRWTPNTRAAISYTWKLIEPLWSKPLRDITKASIDLHLLKLAEADKSASTVDAVRVRLHSILDEALNNDFIPKNPARKVEMPRCKPAEETRALSEDEVRRLWDKTTGRDYVVWRLLLLTGARIGEILALDRGDLLPEGLRIDESARNGHAETTKNKKTRMAPLPESLRGELEEWLATHQYHLMFTSPGGKMLRRNDIYVRSILETARAAAGIPDLTYRTCRTTFATLFDGDIRDAQEILGHHSAAFTLRVYRKPIAARQQGAVDAMDERLRRVVEIRKAG